MTRLSLRLIVVAMVTSIASFATSAASQTPRPPRAPGTPQVAVDTIQQRIARESAAVDSSQNDLIGYYAIPDIPATSLLGVTPGAVTRPGTAKDFATTILDGIGADGRVRQGFAIEGSLGLLRAVRVPLETYQSNWVARFLSNFLISVATARAAGDTGSTDLAWGVRAPIYDGGDPYAKREWTKRLGDALLRCAPIEPLAVIPRNTGQTQAQADSEAAPLHRTIEALNAAQVGCLEKAAEQIGKQAADSLWSAPRLVASYASSLRFVNSELKSRANIADRLSVAGSMPLSLITGTTPILRSTQLIGYLDYSHYHALDAVSAFSATQYGGRLNYGGASANFFYELLGESRSDPPIGVKKNASTWSAGVEFLATKGVWISTGFGKRAEALLQPDKTVIIANIHWGMADKSFLAPH